MNFRIQACNPRTQIPTDRHVDDLAAAIQAIFRADTEDAFLLWNGVPIRMSYKYDLSVLIDDLLPLLAEVLNAAAGSHNIYWASNTFQGEWAVQWAADQIRITATWESVAGRYEDLLNSRNTLEIDRKLFLREWRVLLRKIADEVSRAGLDMEDRSSLDALRKIEAAIPTFGSLYAA